MNSSRELQRLFSDLFISSRTPSPAGSTSAKKTFRQYRTVKRKGRKRGVRVTKESGWRTYHESCEELRADIERSGEDAFTREVVKLCATNSELTYAELEAQVKADVLTARLPDGSPAFQNGNILSRFFRR
jgi:hypothetical protein